MISRDHKFPLRTNFLKLRLKASKLVLPHLIIYRAENGQRPRLGVSIPKKVSKLATTRNYLKRLTYDTLWPQIKDQKIDMVVVFKPLPLKKTSTTQQLLLNELHA